MRWIWRGGTISVLAAAVSLLLARVHPFGDASLYGAKAPQTSLPDSVPAAVRSLLDQKCADCHSTTTPAPLYGHFAPISWLLERDIVAARKAMDLSQWDGYSADQQQTFKAKIVAETKTHEMPLLPYRIVHWNAHITPADIQVLGRWAHDAPAAETSQQSILEGDSVRGQAVFERRCTGCHALAQNHEGPRLQGIYGRTTGAIAGFPYSEVLKRANITWNDQSLEKWLTDPDAFLPGNNMDFLVAKAQERKDLVAYFRQNTVR